MNRKSKITLVIVAALVVFAGILKLAESKKDAAVSKEAAKVEGAKVETPAANQAPEGSTPSDAPKTNISAQLEQMGTCLSLKNSVDAHADPTFAEVNASLKSEFGDVATQNEQWSNTHIQLPNGEERRIRIEVGADNEESSVRKLKYFSVDNEGLPVLIELPKEQTTNPTETFIASLEREGKVTMTEKGMHAYYSQGEEILYTEKNGLLSELEISKNGKSFKCTNLSTAPACKCF